MTPSTAPDSTALAAAALSATLATAAIAIVAAAAAAFLPDSEHAEDATTPAAVVALAIVQERT